MRPGYRSLVTALGIALVAAAPTLGWQSRAEAHPSPTVASTPFVTWQSRVEGQPSWFYPGSYAGVYFWHNEPAGLSLQTTDPTGQPHEYQGTLTTDGTINNLTPVQLESNDTYNLGPAGHVLQFDFHTADEIDGLDFDIGGGTGLKLGVQWDDSSCGGGLCSMPTSNFYLGAGDVSAENNPLWVCREDNGACLRNLP